LNGGLFDPEPSLKELARVSNFIGDELGVPVGLVPLRSAPPKLRLKALLGGERLVIGDFGLYASLVSLDLSEVVDVELELKGICAKPGDSRFFG